MAKDAFLPAIVRYDILQVNSPDSQFAAGRFSSDNPSQNSLSEEHQGA